MVKICLSPSLKCGFRKDGTLSFGFGSIQKIVSNDRLIFNLLKLSSFLKISRTLEEVDFFVIDHQLEDAYLFLKENKGYLISDVVLNSDSRYQRQFLFMNMNGLDPLVAQDKLLNSHVVVIGCGGIGTNISCALATAGIGKITLVDNDQIELTNLNRQFLFDEIDIGLDKTSVLKNRLGQKNGGIDVQCLNFEIKSYSDFNNIPLCDLIILSADTPGEIIFWCNKFSIQKKIPFINVGYVQDIAIVGPFVVPGETGCVCCGNFFAKTNHNTLEVQQFLKVINSKYQAPSIGPINMIASGIASLEVIKYLTGIEAHTLNRRMGYWTSTGLFEYQECTRRKDCEECSAIFPE